MNERYKVLPVHVSDEQRVAASLQMNPSLHEVGRVELRRLEEKPAFVTMERASVNKITLIVREAVERSAARTCLHSAKSRAARKRGLSSMRSTSAASTHSPVPILHRQLVPHEQQSLQAAAARVLRL